MRKSRIRSRYVMHQVAKHLPVKRMAWVVWGISALFCLFQFVVQLSSGAVLPGFMRSFGLSAFGASLLASSYYYIYVMLQLPAGILIDRFGPRRLLTLGAMICALSCTVLALATAVPLAFFARIALGAGCAFAFVGSLSLIARWFPLNRFAVMVSIAETIGMTGACFGTVLIAGLIQHWGWRASFHGFTIIALLLSLVLWGVVRDQPVRLLYKRTGAAPPTGRQLMGNLGILLRNPIAWANALYSGLMYAVITVFVALWGVPYFQLSDQLPLMQASMVADMAFLGVAIGCPLVAWLDMRFRWRRYLLMSSAILSFVLFLLVMMVHDVRSGWLASLMLLVGIACSPYILSFAIGNEIAPPNGRSASLGFVNTLSVGSAPLLQPLIGYLLDVLAPHDHHGKVTYTMHAYHEALIVLLVCFAVAAVLAYYLPEKPLAEHGVVG